MPFLLLESGGALLLESGGAVLLEGGRADRPVIVRHVPPGRIWVYVPATAVYAVAVDHDGLPVLTPTYLPASAVTPARVWLAAGSYAATVVRRRGRRPVVRFAAFVDPGR